MTEQHPETQAEQAKAVGLESLSETEKVIGVRFFVAARPGSPEAARSVLTQTEIRAESLKVSTEGNYNPILEPISISERRKFWADRGNPPDALDQWRERFTVLINNVTDETRIAAFKSILPQNDDALKAKELKDIDKEDAIKLFNEYSNNKSDIDLFMRRAITNLTAQGVLQPAALQAHIAHLRWIGTGFFGKETASMIGTQILFEIERKQDLSVAGRSVVSDFIDSNLERVNNLGPEEAEILRVVHQQAVLWEEEKKKQPVVQVPVYDEGDFLPGPIENPGAVRAEPKEGDDPTPPPVAEGARVAEGQPPVDANPPSVSTTTSTAEAGSPTISNPSSARPRGATPAQTRGTETSGATRPTATVESVKELGKGNRPLMEELNDELRRSTGKDNLTFGVPPNTLMQYMISSLGKDMKTEVGQIQIDKNGKEITIPQAKISKTKKIMFVPVTGTVTLNNINISNNPDNPGKLSATVGKIDKNTIAQTAEWVLGGIDIEQKISTISDTFLQELKKRIAPRNPSWTPKSLSISKGMITVGFAREQTTS